MTHGLAARLTQGAARPLLLMNPVLTRMPLPMQRFDDPFLPFGRAIVEATRAHVGGYVFDFAAYLAIGAAGVVALERTIALLKGDSALAAILHGPLWGPHYARAVSLDALALDAVTLCQAEDAAAYTRAGVYAFPPQLPGQPGWQLGDDGRLSLNTEGGPVGRTLPPDMLLAGRGDDFAEQVAARIAAYSESDTSERTAS
jgi:hypothetical protein